MKTIPTIMIILILTCLGNLVSGQKIDTIVFRNGNVVTGEIKWLELGILEYKTDAAGTIQVKWERVKSLKSPRMFDIRTVNGARYFGSFAPAGEDFKVHVVLLNDSLTMVITDIVDVHPLQRNFWTRLDGYVDLGFNYTKASDVTQLNASSSVEYYGERWSSVLHGNSNITTQPGKDQSRRQDANLEMTRFLRKRFNIISQAGVEQNTELGLDLRARISLGASKELFYTRRNFLNILAGLSVNREWVNGFESSTNNLEAFVGSQFKIFKHISPKIDIKSYILAYPSLTNWGRIRVNFETKARFEIITDLFVGLTFYDAFDNKPAAVNAGKNDWGVITSVGYSF